MTLERRFGCFYASGNLEAALCEMFLCLDYNFHRNFRPVSKVYTPALAIS